MFTDGGNGKTLICDGTMDAGNFFKLNLCVGAFLRWARFTAVVLLFLGAMFVVAPPVSAQGIRYVATNLTDVNPGQDLWEYSYFIGGYNFQTNQGFTVYFDPQLYSQLQNPRPSLSPIWNTIVVQADTVLHQPGFFDGLALVNSPSTTSPFQVAFVWLGQGAPPEQAFEFYGNNFQTLFTGTTVVPEPRGFILAGVGGLIFGGRQWRRWRKKD